LPILSPFPLITLAASAPLICDLLLHLHSTADIQWLFRAAAPVTVMICWQIHRWRQQGEQELETLEALKYEAPGA
jgi:hypothetical protein